MPKPPPTLQQVLATCEAAAKQVEQIKRATRAADKAFEDAGGSTRHWVIECFLPALENEGLMVVTSDQVPMTGGDISDQSDADDWTMEYRRPPRRPLPSRDESGGHEPKRTGTEWTYLGAKLRIENGVVSLVYPAYSSCLTILAIHRCCAYAIAEGDFYGGDELDIYACPCPSIRANDLRVSFRPGVLDAGTEGTLVSLGFVNRNNEWAWRDIRTPEQLAEALRG